MDVGLALWTMQSTAAYPRGQALLYEELYRDACTVAELGFGSLWFAEHRFWYDGWCSAPLVAAAGLSARVEGLRFGTAVSLPAQHDAARFRETALRLDRVSGGRLDLGVGLGHRDTEFDGLGLRRGSRGRRMDQTLDVLCAADSSGRSLAGSVWVGGIAERALRRAATRGLNVLLPQTLYPAEVVAVSRQLGVWAREAGRVPGRVAMQQDLWLDSDAARAREYFLPRLAAHYREEAGAWWVMKHRGHGFAVPEALATQVRRVVDTAAVGTADDVATKLRRLVEAGVQQLIIRVKFDVTADRWQAVARTLAAEVLPALKGVDSRCDSV